MIKEGLYSVSFQALTGGEGGAGVIYVSSGHLYGGDSVFFYRGQYHIEGNQLSASVLTDRHNSNPEAVSIFGRDKVHLTLIGEVRGDDIACSGTVEEVPGAVFECTLRWLRVEGPIRTYGGSSIRH